MLNRRHVLMGAMGLSLAGCDAVLGVKSVAALYVYTVRLRIDGVAYVFVNGGRFHYAMWRSNSVFSDFPMPAAAKLPTGEVVLVRPPSIEWPVRHALTRAKLGWEDVGLLRQIAYDPDQRPHAFLFDDPATPRATDAYLNPLSMEAGSRVEFASSEVAITSDDVFQSVAGAFPWYGRFEPQIRQEAGYGWAGLFGDEPRHDDVRPRRFPSLHGSCAVLTPSSPSASRPAPQWRLPPTFQPLLDELAAGRRAQAALELDPDGGLRWREDPRVARLVLIDDKSTDEIETWRPSRNVAFRDAGKIMFTQAADRTDRLVLGDFAFRRLEGQPRPTLISADGMTRLTYSVLRLRFPLGRYDTVPALAGLKRDPDRPYALPSGEPDYAAGRTRHGFAML